MAQALTPPPPPPPPPPMPPGCRFRPEDHELITYYLKPRVMGRQLPCNIIKNIDLYGPHSTPWLLFDLHDPHSWDVDIKKPSEKSLYVFTSLSKLVTDPHNTTMKSRFNINRKAGCGTWAQRTKCDLISDRDGNVIGGKRMLVFEINDVGDQFGVWKGGYFRMHEYSLCGVNENLGCDDLVVCKITFDSSKKSPFKLVTKNSNVSRSGSESRNKKRYKNLEGSFSSTSESVTVMNSNVSREIRSSNSESLVTMDCGVGNGDLGAAAQYNVGVQDSDELGGGLNFDNLGDEGFCLDDLGGLDLCLDDLGGEGLCLDDLCNEDAFLESFDIDGFMQSMPSNQAGEQLGDRNMSKPGKRKFEGENSCLDK